MSFSHELAVLQENDSSLGSSMGRSVSICSSVLSPKISRGCRGIFAPAPEAPSPLLLLSLWGLQCCSSHFFLPSLLTACVVLCGALSFLKHYCRGATNSAEGLSCALHWVQWSSLELAVSGMRQAQPLLTETVPAAPPKKKP